MPRHARPRERARRAATRLLPILAFFCLAAISPAPAATGGGAPGIAARAVEFTAIPGVRDFSHRLIARPLQPDALARQGLNSRQIAASLAAAREEMVYYEVIHHVATTDDYVFEVPAGMTENGVARRLMETGLFQYVEPDWILYPVACPDDPQFGNQWHHQSNRMQSCAGWDIHTGSPSVGSGSAIPVF